MSKVILISAGLLGITGVMVGAYGAHGLEARLLNSGADPELVPKKLQQCDIAVRYHLLHAVALLALGLASPGGQGGAIWAAGFWSLGVLLFSGGLYSIVFLGVLGHWAIVPTGGVCMMAGWAGIVSMGLGRLDQKS